MKNKIKIDEDGMKSIPPNWNMRYLYTFEGPYYIDDDSIKKGEKHDLNVRDDFSKVHMDEELFSVLIKDFAVKLRQNIYGEKFEDLYTLPIDRLVRKEPLTEEESVSKLIEKDEKNLLNKLIKKYGIPK